MQVGDFLSGAQIDSNYPGSIAADNLQRSRMSNNDSRHVRPHSLSNSGRNLAAGNLSRQGLSNNAFSQFLGSPDHLRKLDSMIGQEEMQTGKHVFKRGSDLRHGLIDVQGVLDVIQAQREDNEDIPRSARQQDATQGLPPKKPPRKAKSTDKNSWKMAMKVLAKNPQLLMESVPSVWD